MKKGLVTVSILLLLAVSYSVPTAILGESQAVRVSYYTRNNVEGAVYMFDDIYMVECDMDERVEVEDRLADIVGISYVQKGDYDSVRRLVDRYNIAVQSSEVVDGIHIIYGLTEHCGQTRYVNGRYVNIQIALNKDVVTVGTPLIMGSY